MWSINTRTLLWRFPIHNSIDTRDLNLYAIDPWTLSIPVLDDSKPDILHILNLRSGECILNIKCSDCVQQGKYSTCKNYIISVWIHERIASRYEIGELPQTRSSDWSNSLKQCWQIFSLLVSSLHHRNQIYMHLASWSSMRNYFSILF